MQEVGREQPDLYYQSTSEIAQRLKQHLASGAALHPEDRKLVERLSPRDIAVLLSLH